MNDLCSAIESNDIAAVKSLLADDAVDVNARIDQLKSPLLVLAADLGRVEIVTLLLDAGARIDGVNVVRDTACHVAVRKGHADVVELLVARKANVALRNWNKKTPIGIAIAERNERMIMLLIDAAMAAGKPPLDDETIGLAATVSADVIRLLLFKHRINLSAIRDSKGRTPLHQAVWRESDESVFKMLIEVAGVDVDVRETSGLTAVNAACWSENACALVRLIVGNANLDLADKIGRTPLHYCTNDSTDQIACCLLAAGANVHAKADNGRTACHGACECSHASLPALLAFGANLDEPDNDGVTPRQLLRSAPPSSDEIEVARRHVLGVRLSLVRKRAFEVCIGLQSLGLDALCICKILLHSCGPVAPFVPFHQWWQIATKIKHFRGSNQ